MEDMDCLDNIELEEDVSSNLFTNLKTKVMDYKDHVFSFFKPILGEYAIDQIQNQLFYMIIHRVMNKCEEKAIDMLNKVDKNILTMIYKILLENREVIQYSDEFLQKIVAILDDKSKGDECVILHPRLDDILDDNIYKLTNKNNTYAVPLWHSELVYDQTGSDLYVKCLPILPDNVEIDDQNNMYVTTTLEFSNIINLNQIEIVVGKHVFLIDKEALKITRRQTVTLFGKGIARLNTDDIFDVSKRAKVHITIDLI
jgi:hypothetical protein